MEKIRNGVFPTRDIFIEIVHPSQTASAPGDIPGKSPSQFWTRPRFDSQWVRVYVGASSLLPWLVLGLLFAATAIAQDTATGAIRGTVGDSGGARIGASSVVLVNSATNFAIPRPATALAASPLSCFRRAITRRAPSRRECHRRPRPALHVDVGGTTELAFKLAVAGTKETVTVSGRAAAGRKSAQRTLLSD